MEARRLWTDLGVVFKNVASEKKWVDKATAELARLDDELAKADRFAPLRAALKQAETLRDEGQIDQAEAIWRAIEDLYRNDAAANELLDAIKAARGKGK